MNISFSSPSHNACVLLHYESVGLTSLPFLPLPTTISKKFMLIRVPQGEHGIGLGKKESLVKELGVDTIDVMRSIKKALDPRWLLNPGKIFDSVHMNAKESKDNVMMAAALHIERREGQ